MTTPGKIIEYVEHGKFICAAVMADSGKRVHLLNLHGREINLPLPRIVHCSSQAPVYNISREETLVILKEIANRRQSINLPVSMEEVWQLANESTEKSFSTRFLTELCFDNLATDDHEAAFLRAIFIDRIFFKYKDGRITAHTTEVVEQLQAKQDEAQQKESLLKQGAKGLSMIMTGKNMDNWTDRGQCLHLVKEYYLFGKEADNFETARELLKKAGLTNPHDPFHLIVKTGIWDKNENIGVLRHHIPLDFSEESLAQALEIKNSDEDSFFGEGRVDLRDLPILTIDGKGTKDFDDAIHIERKDDHFIVGIHITDVSHYIKQESPLFKTATERTTSIYFPDGTIPMLPITLSEDVFSLVEGKDRPALSFLVELSSTGMVLSHKIVRSIVRIKRQLNYQDAEKTYRQDPDLRDLVMLSQKLKQNRIESGALIIPIPDVSINISHTDSVSIKLLSVESNMRVLISEFMVLTNSLGAEFLALRQEPGLFRSQREPQKRLFKDPQDDLYLNFRQRRHLSRGILSTVPKRHSGVGVEQYTTMTSPIRRLLDLAMQLQITSILQGKGPCFTTKDLTCLTGDMAAAGSRCNLVRQLRHRFWILKYLEPKQGGSEPAFILARNNKRVRVVFTRFLLEGELPPNQGIHAGPGDNIMVRIAKVKPLDNVLQLEWG